MNRLVISPLLAGVKVAYRKLLTFICLTTLLLSSSAAPALAQSAPDAIDIQPYIDRVTENVTEFTLQNGMRFIVLERHQAPVISFMTYVDVGAAYEEEGKTGAAHYLEHLAFKGTKEIGTLDYSAEQALFEQMDAVFSAIKAARAEGQPEEAIAPLMEEFEQIRAQASELVQQNQYGQIVEQAGGVGLNATTSADATRYFYSFPANKLELWMSLESERFLEPVFREFYEEKEVILEERRLRTDNSPIGQMVEAFLETAFPGHPYGRPVIGYADDLEKMTRQDIREFFETYYTPGHMIMAVVGDVDPEEVRPLAEIYFDRFAARPDAPSVSAVPPVQTETQEITLELPSEPWYFEGFQRPDLNHPDHQVYQMIEALLVNGRTSRLYQALVEQQQIALNIGIANGFPGERYSNLFLVYAATTPDHTIEEAASVMSAEIEKLKTELVSPEELARVKTQARAGLLRTLSSNQGLASLLPAYEAKTGDWRNLFEEINAIEAVTAEDVQRVAQEMFRPENLTIGKILSQS